MEPVTAVKELKDLIEWAIYLITPVATALTTALYILWKKLNESNKKLLEQHAKCQQEKDQLQKEWRKDIQEMDRNYYNLLAEIKSVLVLKDDE